MINTFFLNYFKISILVLALSSCSDNKTPLMKNYLAKNIIGGSKATTLQQKENGIVGLVINGPDGQDVCTGTLISKRIILTAAHCLFSAFDKPKAIIAIFTENIDQSKPQDIRYSLKATYHSKFTESTMSGKDSFNDIGLILLGSDAPANFKITKIAKNTIKPKINLNKNLLVSVAGFGLTSLESKPAESILNVATGLKLVGISKDQNELYIDETTKGTCHGDSGGPAFINNIQVGINSRNPSGENCLGKGIYTNISNYTTWLREESLKLLSN